MATAGPTNPTIVSLGQSFNAYALGFVTPDGLAFVGGIFDDATSAFTSGPTGSTTFEFVDEAFLSGTMNISLIGGGTLSIDGDSTNGIVTSGSITLGPKIVTEPASLICGTEAVLKAARSRPT